MTNTRLKTFLIVSIDEGISCLPDSFLAAVEATSARILVASDQKEALAIQNSRHPELIFYNFFGKNKSAVLTLAKDLKQSNPGGHFRNIGLVDAFSSESGIHEEFEIMDDLWMVYYPEVIIHSKLKSALKQLNESKEFSILKKATDVSGVGIVISNPNLPDNPIIYSNAFFTEMTGYEKEEVLGRNCRFLQGNDQDQPERERLKSHIQNGEECEVRLRNYRKDGNLFWNNLHLKPILSDGGEPAYFIGIQHDISDQVLLEELLGESLDSKEALEACPSYIWMLESPHKWTFLNQVACRYVGSSEPSAWMTAVHQEDIGTLISTIEEARHQEEASSCEVRVRSHNGDWRKIVHHFASRNFDKKTQPVIIGSGSDVTDFRAAEKLLFSRQRYLTALSILQKNLLKDITIEKKISIARNIITESLDASDLAIAQYQDVGDGITVKDLFAGNTLSAGSLKQDLFQSGEVQEKFKRGQHHIYSDKDTQMLIYSAGRVQEMDVIILIQWDRPKTVSRSEMDFLKNIGYLLRNIISEQTFFY